MQAELEKILASRTFASSEQLRSFLRFTVEKTLDGSGHQIKEYVVGLEVFNRGESFDPRTDSIVRAQAKNLRSRLERYYASEGSDDGILIEYPKGSYTPIFRRREASVPLSPARQLVPRKTLWLIAAGVALGVLASSWFLAGRRPRPASEGPSIAVLPFVDMSADKDQDYFCDGITEELINALAQVQGLRVVARTSAFEFKGKGRDIRRIGEQLNVGTVLEGSVRKAGDRLRVTAQLNNVADGYHLWSETYDRELKDVFAIQEEIAQAIVKRLKLAGDQKQPRIRSYSEDLDAYDQYLRGRQQLNTMAAEGVKLALDRFQQTLVRAPAYAPAYAATAEAYYWLAMRSGMPPKDAYPKAREAAQKALALDDGLAEAHSSLAAVLYSYDWDWKGAEREFRRALALSPNQAAIHFIYGRYLTSMARLDEALHEMRRAEDLDPLSLPVKNHAGTVLLLRQEYDQSIELYRQMISLDPGFYMAYSEMGLSLLRKHKNREAMEAFAKGWDLSGHRDPMALAWLGNAAGITGDRAKAEVLLPDLQRLSKERYVRPAFMAFILFTPVWETGIGCSRGWTAPMRSATCSSLSSGWTSAGTASAPTPGSLPFSQRCNCRN